MKKGMGILVAVVAIPVLVVLWGIGVRNGLVREDENLNTAWAQVETVLQRRFDLIPKLVNTVKGYATHEKELLENIAKYRTAWADSKTQADKIQAGGQLEGALSRLMVAVESYPDLKANANFMALQDELAGTENRISTERQRYNEATKKYNLEVRTFPKSFIASMFKFNTRPYFESAEGAKVAPTVAF